MRIFSLINRNFSNFEIIATTTLQHLAVLYNPWAKAGGIPHCRNILPPSSCLVLAMISQKILDFPILLTKNCSYEEYICVLTLKLFTFLT